MNQNSNKDQNRYRRNAPIDGISGRPVTRFNQGGSATNFGTPQRHPQQPQGQPKPTNTLSDFRRNDGFHSTQQQQINQPQRPAHAPPKHVDSTVFVERPAPKKKRGLFGRKKSGKPKKHVSKKKKIFRIIAIIFIIFALITGFLVAKGYITLRKVLPGGGGAAALEMNVDPSKLKGEGDGRVNILLLGRGGEGHEGADLTDTIILASIDPIAKEAALVSIPRDFWVPVKGQGSMKINSVFSAGKGMYRSDVKQSNEQMTKDSEAKGFELLESTVEETFGVPVHYHVMVDFKGFEEAVDIVGGVTINVPSPVVEQMRINGQKYLLNVQAGQKTMYGFEALAYARSRYTSPRGDFDRAERQRLLITALKDKIISAGTVSNPQKMSNLMSSFGNHVITNFNIADLQRLYQLSQEIPSSKINSIGLSDPPNNYVKTSAMGSLSVVIPTAGEGNFKDIQSFMRNALKDSYLKNENASIMVLNGTTRTGFATEKGEELKTYGYTIPQVGNAPTKNYPTTIIVDLRNGEKKYTKSYLEKRFGVTAVNSIPDPAITPGTADFVIILGSDQANQ